MTRGGLVACLPSVSDRRIGNRLSKVTIAKPQNSSTPTSASSTRDARSSPMPSPMTLRHGPDRGRHGRDTAGVPMLVHEDQDRDQVDDAERRARRGSAGRASGWRRTDRARRGAPESERAERDREAEHGAPGAQALLDPGVRLGRQGRVDVPRFERPAVERPVDALEEGHRGEHRDRVGDVQQAQRRRARPGSRRSARAAGRAHRTGRRSAARGTARPGPGG